VCCIADIFIQQAMKKQCAALPIPLPANSGGEVSCIADIFIRQAMKKQCAALPIPLPANSGGEVSCIPVKNLILKHCDLSNESTNQMQQFLRFKTTYSEL
jgi:hypothetical protein